MIYELDGIRPQCGERVWIAPNASVIGNVILEDDVSVWFGAVIRGDHRPMRIGRRSNVQDLAVLHDEADVELVVGENVTIGHKAMVHGCAIGDNTLIGINAVILNNARIGSNCLIGANSLVTEGKEIPDGSLVMGAPGKVVRPLRPEEIESLAQSAQNYVDNGRRFAAGLGEAR